MEALRWLALLVGTSMAIPAQAAEAAKPAAARPAPAMWLSPLDRAHAQALDSFRRARFSEAYGRFIRLAEAGHPASARYAIWMCENGSALFGVLWDCAPQEMDDWHVVASLALSTRVGATPGQAARCR